MSTEREASLFIDGKWVHAADGGLLQASGRL